MSTTTKTTLERVLKDSFPGSVLDSTKWNSINEGGGSITVASNQVAIASGTNINNRTGIVSKLVFQCAFRVMIGITLSQRIANQEFKVELIECTEQGDILDNRNGLIFSGVTATNGIQRVKDGGTVVNSSALTLPTTAGGSFFELEFSGDDFTLAGGTTDSTTVRTNVYKKHRMSLVKSRWYRLMIYWQNGASAPASTTTATITFVSVKDYFEQTFEQSYSRGGANASIPVSSVGGTVTVSGTVTANVGTSGISLFTDTSTPLAASATFTGTSRDAGATAAYNKFSALFTSDQAGTCRVERSTDNVTWRRASNDIALAANANVEITVPVTARYHRVILVNGATLQGIVLVTSSYLRQ